MCYTDTYHWACGCFAHTQWRQCRHAWRASQITSATTPSQDPDSTTNILNYYQQACQRVCAEGGGERRGVDGYCPGCYQRWYEEAVEGGGDGGGAEQASQAQQGASKQGSSRSKSKGKKKK
jgi:hypothetical protein